jgi:hypothetical protein
LIIAKGLWATQLVESQPVKRRLGGSCEMAASLEVSQLRVDFAQEAVKIGHEHMKVKNLLC